MAIAAAQGPVHTIGIDQDALQSWGGDLNGGEDNGSGSAATPLPNQQQQLGQAQDGNGEKPSLTKLRDPAQDLAVATKPWWVDPVRTGPAALPTAVEGAPSSRQRSHNGIAAAGGVSSSTQAASEAVVSSALTSSITEPSNSNRRVLSSTRTYNHHNTISRSTYTIEGNSWESTGIPVKPNETTGGLSGQKQQSQQPPGKTPVGLIAGIAAAVFILGVAVFLLVFFLRRRRLQRCGDDHSSSQELTKHDGNNQNNRFSTFSEGPGFGNEKANSIGELEGEQTTSKTALTSPAATGTPGSDSPSSQNSIGNVRTRGSPEMEQISRPSSSNSTHLGLMYHPRLQQIRHVPDIDLSKFTQRSDDGSMASPTTPKTPPLLPELPQRPTPPRTIRSRGAASSHSHSRSAASGQRSPRKNKSTSSVSMNGHGKGEKSSFDSVNRYPSRKRSQTSNSIGSNKSPRFPSDVASKASSNLGLYKAFPSKDRGMQQQIHNVAPITPPPTVPLPSPTGFGASVSEGLTRAASTGSIGTSSKINKSRSQNTLMAISEKNSIISGSSDENRRSELDMDARTVDEEKLQVEGDPERERSSIVSSSHSSVLHMSIKFKDIKDSPVMSRRLTEKSIKSITDSERGSCALAPIGGSNSCNISSFEFDLSEVPRDAVVPERRDAMLSVRESLNPNRAYAARLDEEEKKRRAMSSVYSLNPLGQTFFRDSVASTRWPNPNTRSRAFSVAVKNDDLDALALEEEEENEDMEEELGFAVPVVVNCISEECPAGPKGRKESLDSLSEASSTEEPFVGTAKQIDVISLKDNESRASLTSIVSRPNSRQNLHMSVDSRGISPRFSTFRSPSPNGDCARPTSQMSVRSENGRSPTPGRLSLAVDVNFKRESLSPISPEQLNIQKVSPAPSPVQSPTLVEPATTEITRTLSVVSKGRERAYSSSTMKFVDLYRSSRYSHPEFKSTQPVTGVPERWASYIPHEPLPPLPSPPPIPGASNNNSAQNSPTGVSGLPGSMYQSRPMSIPAAANARAFKEAMKMATLPSLAVDSTPIIPDRSSSRPEGADIQLLDENILTSPLLLFAPTLQRASVSINMDSEALMQGRKASIDEIELRHPPPKRNTLENEPVAEEDEEEEEEEDSAANTTFDTAVTSSTTPTSSTSSLDGKFEDAEPPRSPVKRDFGFLGYADEKSRSKHPRQGTFDFGDFREMFSSSRGW